MPPELLYPLYVPQAKCACAPPSATSRSPDAPAGQVLRLDPQGNRFALSHMPGWQVSRQRGLCLFLWALLERAHRGCALDLAELQQLLQENGQPLWELQRRQALGLVHGLERFLKRHAALPWQLHYAPRQIGCGPWRLELRPGALPWVVDAVGQARLLPASLPAQWSCENAPRLLQGAESDLLQLAQLLTALANHAAFWRQGDLQNALETLPDASACALSAECMVFMDLRRANILRRMGRHEEAHAVLQPWCEAAAAAQAQQAPQGALAELYARATQADPFRAPQQLLA